MKKAEDCEFFLEQALDYIGQNNVLSPLLVLEILSDTKEAKGEDYPKLKRVVSTKQNVLRFKVLKKFLLNKLKTQVESIDKNNDKV